MTDQPSPASRREVLAFIALQAELPMPNGIDLEFGGTAQHMGLDLDRAVDAARWAEAFGLTREPSVHRWVSDDGDWDVANTSIWGYWRGWRVQVAAVERAPHASVTELDEGTVSKLQEIAGGDQ